jgi:protein transport protein SEC24
LKHSDKYTKTAYKGLRIAEHFGNFYQRNVTDLEFGTVDADKAIAALVKHESKLDDKKDAHFQCAVLYTSATGERRVRLHNVAVPVTQVMSNVFRFADMDATIAYCTKEGQYCIHDGVCHTANADHTFWAM